MKTLIVVDMQNDFVTGSLGTNEAKLIVQNVKQKIKEYQNNGDAIIFTRDTHNTNYLETQEGINLPVKHCIQGSGGWNIVDNLDDCSNCKYINKDSFGWTHWDNFSERDEIEIVGLCTDICVISNAIILKSMFPETPIIVNANCCAGVTPDSHKNALNAMRMCQIKIIGE